MSIAARWIDRSTGWRLGTNRVIQFRYQVVGIISGALLAVAFAQLFMNAYPVLQKNIYENPGTEGAAQWQSAMTFKIVGALSGLTQPKPYLLTALLLGLLIGLFTEILRKCIKNSRRYIQFVSNHKHGKTTDFLLDGVLLPSPYASSFGGFVDFSSCAWFALGGTLGSLMDWISTLSQKSKNSAPADMSTVSLIGGGLIAGDSLAALAIGITPTARNSVGLEFDNPIWREAQLLWGHQWAAQKYPAGRGYSHRIAGRPNCPASPHLTPDRECSSSLIVPQYRKVHAARP